ncbi:probable E3 ubiquitin-protein ligase RHG1A [Andrographis paniculata]|uniref:probable E3 ubiquitin-protein ligase RHG1A n=1 Tax=Andrographis paniculata TaxID=175694 RepID=UPI0021E70FD9|nr:probable E3 ubiquitin-protein ligase RHG1A [Andrographis paniculata]XP_051136945.1 probable E3 ubiquitin-protein ligase RHG1A [Andrographis paniculata]
MDRYSSKKVAGGLVMRRKGCASFKDAATHENDRGAQFCNRIGCHGRIKYCQNAKTGGSDKAKLSKSSSRSSNGNEVVRKSTSSCSTIPGAKKSNLDSKRKLSSPPNIDSTESSVSSESEASDLSQASKSGEVTVADSGSSKTTSNIRRKFHPKSRVNQNTLPSLPLPPASRSSCSSRNVKCNSVSGNPARCSSLEPEPAAKNRMKKRSSDGENSLSRNVGKTNAASVLPQMSKNGNTRLFSRQNGRNGLSARQPADKGTTFNNGCSSTNLKRSIFMGEGSGGPASGRTRRTMNGNTSRLNGGTNSLSIRQPDARVPQASWLENSVQSFPGGDSRSYIVSGNNGNNPSAALPHDYLYRYNNEGVSELLLALDRVDQHQLTHEQILALETTLFHDSYNSNDHHGSYNAYDRHHGMRMDIDNMSYEELLELGERMGTVSTALSEEALSNCLKKSAYQPTPSKSKPCGDCDGGGENDDDDAKCSICQEEYVTGDEIGRLVECCHGYHATCINQWLRMKNWCPICKAAAAPAAAAPSPARWTPRWT